MSHPRLNRRAFLHQGLALGCSAAALPLLTHATFAAAPIDHRIVVVILRGAMDGLDIIRPAGDPLLRQLRPKIAAEEGIPLGDFWQLHPRLGDLMPLWRAGELGFVQAVSTPYRDQRSHFDGQDLLEAGIGMDAPAGFRRDGWLNRLLAGLPGAKSETAFAIGREALPILSGAAPVHRWQPETTLALSAQGRRLLEQLYEGDMPFHIAAATALELTGQPLPLLPDEEEDLPLAAPPPVLPGAIKSDPEVGAFARFAAAQMREETRIVALSLPGWDSHAGQAGAILRPMARLSQLILTLRAELGPVWQKTAFMAMTEFGRTVRENGSAGTDHGTGGAMVTAGGAIRGGAVLGTWPGLSEDALYAGRDLMPTGDVRSVAGWVIHALTGAEKSRLSSEIFPGLDLGPNPGIV
ncbi:DUF1501 domain-containing protein [Falsigemmobacter faecalis]|uniref:DUF1501 domain-containing protein n=1 Tax=Falsigemmobacter faecalis TaxID=2488730 RepID=A0A3P3D530_9RHOB|nr:DUF1501 domain-containing protein [Falsigemmobacter faecalis]RRH69241.1 DUF1501 domain-containing protein [Falsigemmobacter faecalis]